MSRLIQAPPAPASLSPRARAASRGLRAAPKIAPPTGASRRPRSSANGTRHPRDACTSHENAAAPSTAQQLVRVTHPFHPLFAQHLPCVGRRYNRYGERLLLQARNGAVWSVPPGWTDVANPDPSVVMGQGRSLLRVSDLMELADLVGRLSGKSAGRPRSAM